MDVPAELTKEVGVGKIRLPIGLWVVAGAVGIWIARKAKASGGLLGGGASSASSSTTDPTQAPDPLNAITLPSLAAGGAVNVVPGGGFNSGQSSAITDNEQWRVAAQSYLAAQGFDALAAASAVAKYLNGDDLTPAEAAMIEKALRYLGPTPEPVGPAHVLPTPTPTPKPTPKPTPTPTPTPTAHIIATAYPRTLAANANTLAQIGTVTAHGYVGKQSNSGAPVYALVGTAYGPRTSYEQGHPIASLPVGTGIFTLPQFAHLFT